MEYINAIIQGIIQGLTEFLPVSSSGHLSLYQHFSNIKGDDATLLSVLLHLGTLAAVFIVYYKTIFELIIEFFSMVKDIFTRKFTMRRMNPNRRMIIMLFISCVPLLLLLIPVGGDKKIMDVVSGLATDNDIIVEGVAFLFTAFLLIYGASLAQKKRRIHKINTTDAVAIGFAQLAAAAFAGVSRSGSTISTGMICGVRKEYMVRYSFILGIPAILAANVVEIKDAVQAGSTVNVGAAILGIIVAAAVGVCAIKLLEILVKKDMFKYFGYYCLALGAVTTVYGIVELAVK